VIDEVVKKIGAPALRAYVVWVPVLPDDDAVAAARAAARFAGDRVTQYWDGARSLGWMLGQALGLPPRGRGTWGVAWDVYLVYGRGASWDDVKKPALWMQQLDDVPAEKAPKLDAAALRKAVESLPR
jgi:hypothetical protein